MKPIKSALATALLLSSSYANAGALGVDARSMAMGNVSVATANIATAALANPAMLALQKQEDDFALLLPALGIYIDDSDKLTDAIDDFQVIAEACDASGSALSQACMDAPTAFGNLVGRSLAPQVTGAIALGISGEEYSFAITARSDASVAGGVNDTDFPVDLTPTGILREDANFLQLIGIQTKEVGFSVAKVIDVVGHKVAVGVTPKVVSAEHVEFRRSVATLDTDAGDLLDENFITDLGSFTTLDAGVMLGLAENMQVGLVVRNLLGEELTGTTSNGPVKLKFDPQLRVGAAYTGDIVTVGVDMDLTENDPVVTAFGAEKTRQLSVGAEIDAFDIAQLRVGMLKNMADGANDDAILTAGVGFWLGFTLDISVLSGDDVFGGFIQTGFRW